jgi:hypothetical protein
MTPPLSSCRCRCAWGQATKLRQDARQARGAEADSSVATHQLEARLAVAAIEHKQDVRRLTETIEARPADSTLAMDPCCPGACVP